MRGGYSCAGRLLLCGEVTLVRGGYSCAGRLLLCGEVTLVREA